MIINATTGTGFGGALLYVNKENVDLTKETKPEILELNHIFGTPREQAIQMRFVAKENSRSSRPVLHLSVSFSLEEKLEHKKVNEVLRQVVREFGATPDNNQYSIVKHNDAGHEHYHIVLNKVGFDGRNIDTSYVQNRAHIVADKIEQQQGLRPTEGRRILYDPSNEKGYRYATKEELAKYKPSKKVFKDKKPNVKKAKEEIQSKVIDVLHYAKSPQEFKVKLAAQGVDVRYSEDRENGNAIRGASFRTDDIAVKGGDIGFKWNEINACLEHNQQQEKPYRYSVEELVSHIQKFDLPEQKRLLEKEVGLVQMDVMRDIDNPQLTKQFAENNPSRIVLADNRLAQIKPHILAVEEKIQQENPYHYSVEELVNSIQKFDLPEQKRLLEKEVGLVQKDVMRDINNPPLTKKFAENNPSKIVLADNRLAQLKPYILAVEEKIQQEKPIGKQAEMENKIIILEHQLIKIKQYAEKEKAEKENTKDYKALNEVVLMKIKANRELLDARDELADYKGRVEHLQDQNEDLTILQIDKIIKEQEEKGEQRGNYTSMSR